MRSQSVARRYIREKRLVSLMNFIIAFKILRFSSILIFLLAYKSNCTNRLCQQDIYRENQAGFTTERPYNFFVYYYPRRTLKCVTIISARLQAGITFFTLLTYNGSH